MGDIRDLESRLRRAGPRSKEQKRINCLQEGIAGLWETLAGRSPRCALMVEISRWQLWVHQVSEPVSRTLHQESNAPKLFPGSIQPVWLPVRRQDRKDPGKLRVRVAEVVSAGAVPAETRLQG